ncbi:MAG: hypothetical protein AB7E39_06230 [Endomicrobiaceae bacterium]
MPKTKFQEFIFTAVMVIVMVYFITLYNSVLNSGFSFNIFVHALFIIWPEVLVAFILQKFFVSGIVLKSFPYIVSNFNIEHPFFISVVRCVCTLLFMLPCMTLYVSVIHNGFHPGLLSVWAGNMLRNSIFVLFLQIFFAGPFVRFVFRTIYEK